MATYKYCGSSQTGESHIKTGTGCQDFSCFGESNGVFIAAVADGLSSSAHSDIASQIAAKVVVEYCLKRIKIDTNGSLILIILNQAFDEALFEIKKIARDSISDYDTTLSAAVFISGEVYTGQVGDSSIIALREDGLFECVTQTQNGEGEGNDRPTFPLGATQKWVFEKYGFKVKTLYLATDGVLHKLMPPRLENQKWPFDNKYLTYLYSHVNKNACSDSDQGWINDEISSISPNECNHDDKSLIVVVSDDVHLNLQTSEYYQYPDDKLWTRLGIEWEEKLYPYKKRDTPIPPGPNPPSNQTGDPGRGNENPQYKPPRKPPKKPSITNKLILAIAGLVATLLITILVFSPGEKAGYNNGSQQVFTEPVNAPDVDIIYDGKPHGIEVNLNSKYKNAIILYGYNGKEYKETESPQITDVQESPLTVYYRVSNKWHKDIYGKAKITILPYDFSNLKISSIEDQTYSAIEITPDLELFIGSYKLTNNKDYILKYSNNKNPGTANIQIIPTKGNRNFIGMKTIEFEITKAKLSIDMENKYTFDINDQDFQLPVRNDAYGIDGITVSGTTTWYLDEECSKRATERDLPDEIGREEILYFKFTPSEHFQTYYIEVIKGVAFIAVDIEKTT